MRRRSHPPSGPGTYVVRGADGRVSGRLTRRSGGQAESRFVIELVAPAAGGLDTIFVDRMLDCRLRFAFDGPVVSIAQTGGCGLPLRASVAGRYRRAAP